MVMAAVSISINWENFYSLSIIVFFQFIYFLIEESRDCINHIYGECLHRTDFSEEEIENARIYIQNRFYRTNPVKPACKKLHVRKDIKCLTDRELSELVHAFKQLYENGVMDTFSLVHSTYWPSVHKFSEAIPWHRWHINQLEKEIKIINPRVSMPYWEYITDFAAPEKSKIWHRNYFGHSGNRHNDYCIPDGPFAYQKVKFPEPHCLRRHWNSNKTIPVWEPPEWLTSITQTSKSWAQFAGLLGNAAHFKTHLSVGGFEGDMSVIYATNDPIFYIFHAHTADYAILKWQLSDDLNLIPQSFNEGSKYDWKTREISAANVESDFFTYYHNVRVKESLQVGFGELCYIHDQLIKPINDIMQNRRLELPSVVYHLRKSLPYKLFAKYFPKFASNSATFFDYFLPDVRITYENNRCQPIPIALSFNSTPNGRRQLDRFKFDADFDVTQDAFQAEYQYYSFMSDLRQYQYCSPYICPQSIDSTSRFCSGSKL